MDKFLNKTTKSGVLNIAPIKLTGKYKVVINEKLELFLDDYTGRRIKIDKQQQFLPQVANFLSTYSNITELNKTKYGAFNHGKQKAFHIPLYLMENDFPKYFVVNRVGNKFVEIQEPIDLYRTANVIKLVDLEQIGLHKIFKEITDEFNQMLFFNLDDSYIDLYGYKIKEISKVKERMLLSNTLSNQPYFEILNNKILNHYQNNELIYPRFINIELEFSDNNKGFEIYNYFGFVGNSSDVKDENELIKEKINVELFQHLRHIEYIQTGKFLEPKMFQNLIYTRTITRTEYQEASVKYSVNNLSNGDYIEIFHPDGSLYYTYIVGEIDIRNTLRESLNVVCKRATQLSNNQFEFILKTEINTNQNGVRFERYWVTIKILIDEDIAEEYTIKHSQVFKPVNEDRFISIQFNDVQVSDYVEADSVVLDNKSFRILMKYQLDNNYYLRLNEEPLFRNRTYLIGDFFIDVWSKIIQLNPIDYYSFNDDLKALRQFDKSEYVKELRKKFVTNNSGSDEEQKQQKEASIEAINSFANVKNYIDELPYVKDFLLEGAVKENTYKLEQTDTINSQKENNIGLVKNVMFDSNGTTSFITPNILNVDKDFWGYNGNINYKKVDYDDLRFHWFLIKSEAPEYTKNDIRNLRYFTDEPKLKSDVILVGNYAETIFLGVKYRMNRKYKGYQFCVYLSSDNDLYMDTVYNVQIRNKTIYVVINKYLDFVDLIRGGNNLNKPFIDLSFFYCVDEPHNSLSNNLISFKTGGVLLCDNKIPVMFEQNATNDWKYFHNGKWYVCLKRSNSVLTDKFTDLFPLEKEVDFYVYSTIKIEGIDYNYLSIKITIKGVYLITDDYLWCEDVAMKFFDVKRLVLNTANPEEFFKVDYDDIIDIKSNPKIPSKPYNEYSGTIDVLLNNNSKQTYRILNIESEFTLKQYYFEAWQKVEFIGNKNVISNGTFVFPEYVPSGVSFTEISKIFDINWDGVTPYEMFTLFDRNQLWLLLKSFMEVNVNFKHSTSTQTRKLINDLLLNNLATYVDFRTLNVYRKDSDFIDDIFDLEVVEPDNNVAIWNIYSDIGSNFSEKRLSKIERIRNFYNPHLRKLSNELEFQNDIQYEDKPLITSYDRVNNPDFKVLQQVQGNVVSSLFVKMDDFRIITEKTDNNTYDVLNLLMNYIDVNDMILESNQTRFIQRTNDKDLYQLKYDYITELMDKFYYINLVYNNLNMSIKFKYDEEEFILVTENNERLILGENPKTIINFKRKE